MYAGCPSLSFKISLDKPHEELMNLQSDFIYMIYDLYIDIYIDILYIVYMYISINIYLYIHIYIYIYP